MYESPKLVRFGQFRDLTLQGACDVPPHTGKSLDNYDALFPKGISDGCPAARS